jgi:hypothetical protein
MPTPIDPMDPPTWPGLATRPTITPEPAFSDAPTPLLDAPTVDELGLDPLTAWSAALATAVAMFLGAFAVVVSAGVLRALL